MLTSGHPFERVNQSAPITILGILLILFGTLVRTWASGILHKNHVLSTAGPYQFVRHPLYAGTLLMMLGACFLLVDPIVAAGLMLLIVTSYGKSIRYEELKLARRFGPLWSNYTRHVPSLIPRFRRGHVTFADWHFDRWVKNREHKTLFATLAILLCFEAYQLIW
jgi:protein-S-isoprenylcysteine O-methyltransferase Ste14